MPQLSNGSASPASGTTATVFTFSVTYSDTKGCLPNWVTVTIAGVGVYPMTGSGTSYDTGVIFTWSMQLPVGSYTYSFSAMSGDAGGRKTTALAAVSPPSVTVTAVATPPPPEPTPKPTPKPTPRPTPVPTPVPTAVRTPVPTDQPTASAPAGTPPGTSGGGSTSESPAPSIADGGVGASQGPAASQPQGGAPGPSSSEGGAPAGFVETEPLGSFPVLLGAWATATGGGLGLFLVLAPRRRREDEPVLAVAGDGMASSDPMSPSEVPQPHPQSELVPPDEVNMPRWLRPSVQAARQGRGPRSNTPRLEDS